MDLKQNESNTTSQDTRTGKPPERLASVHKGLEPLHRSTNSFRTIEPQSSRGAAYLRNTVALMKGEEKRDFSKAEQFKLKRRCASIKAPSDHDIKTLEVRLFSAFTKTYICRATNNNDNNNKFYSYFRKITLYKDECLPYGSSANNVCLAVYLVYSMYAA